MAGVHIGKIHDKREPVNVLTHRAAISQGMERPRPASLAAAGGSPLPRPRPSVIKLECAGSWASHPRDAGRKRQYAITRD
jgi:hypothetical protein